MLIFSRFPFLFDTINQQELQREKKTTMKERKIRESWFGKSDTERLWVKILLISFLSISFQFISFFSSRNKITNI